MKEELSLPKLVQVRDYHEFGEIEDYLNLVTTRKTKVKEVGFDGYRYVGVIYQGRKPDQIELNRLAKVQKIELNG